MKYTLKNRPKMNEELPMSIRIKDYFYKTEQWFKGFEKELREKVGKCSLQHPFNKTCSCRQCTTIWEILGE